MALSAGLSHTCAIIEGGAVECWGVNSSGQLGNGAVVGSYPTPVDVLGITNAVAIATAFGHTCALLSDGIVRCWGLNDGGQLGNGSSIQRSGTPLAVNGAAAAVNAVGATTPVLDTHRLRGVLGEHDYGQLGHEGGTVSNVPVDVVRSVNATTVALGATALALGFDHGCAVLASGEVRCWGRNNFGQLGIGKIEPASTSTPESVYNVSSAMAIASGAYHSCIVLLGGTVQCWGNNNSWALGNSDPAHSTFPKDVAGISTALSITAGFEHTCALLASGTVQCWGRGDEGQLGNGANSNSASPVTVSGISTAVAVAAGNYHSCAVLVGGQVRCWAQC